MPVVGSRAAARFSTALKSQYQVLYALMLHDIKSRFFGNGLGYVVTILWPITHILVIVIAYFISGRVPPFGNDTLVFVVTGVLPYIAWNYISRFCQMTVLQNVSYMQYPVVKFLDLIFARIALEIVTINIITAGSIVVLPLFGSNVIPVDPQNAAFALFSAIFLGIGFGILSAVITRIWPMFMLVYVLFLISFWFTAGVAINPEALPTAIGDLLAWNPLLHSIEWLRSAYFPDAPTRLLSKSYVLYVAATTMTLGLIGQKALRPFFK